MNLDDAIKFANIAHKGMVRKGGNQPYIFHPLEVLNIVSLITLDDDILCAAILHDTVEDTPATIEDIKEKFGDKVAAMVSLESEDKKSGKPKADTWMQRKQEAIDTLINCNNYGAKVVCLADKVSNLRSFLREYLQRGDEFWDMFNQKDPKMHYWYYSSIKDALSELADTSVYKEYCFLIDSIFSKYIGEQHE